MGFKYFANVPKNETTFDTERVFILLTLARPKF
jgi:hypothetical protein